MDRKTPDDPWLSGDPYERYMGRWSRQTAPRFVAWLGLPAAQRWLDVGCGTGALCTAILAHAAPSSVVGVEPSQGFLDKARLQLADRADLRRGSAAALPLEDGAVDATVSGLMLNFAPDAPAALAEMTRVTARGGTVAAYVWDYAGGMQLIRHFWDAAVALDPLAAAFDEGVRFPLCQPRPLADLFARAGLADVEVAALDIDTPFTGFDDFWQPFLGGQGPAPGYAMGLDEAARARLCTALRDRLPMQADGTLALTARAWAARGRVPAA